MQGTQATVAALGQLTEAAWLRAQQIQVGMQAVHKVVANMGVSRLQCRWQETVTSC
jgi:hypothetical protein